LLFGLDGVQVADVDAEGSGSRTVWVVTADPGAAACPGCGTVSAHVKEHVTTCPADLPQGQGQIAVRWVKRRWECRCRSCPRKTFTESITAVPARCRVTARLRAHAACLIADGGRTVTQAARECGLSWPVVHAAFAAHADPLLERPPTLVAHLGIDEHRRGRPRWRIDDNSGEYALLADRWQCAMRRLVVSPAEPGGTRREVPGSDGLPGSER
jgi:transposase